ncbi:MAG: nucleoid-associated protein [Bacteroidales bacterium]|jgi:hypothetical protein|nr:nucleoid-associated protein [Bacteroidales bacterium]
MIFGDSARLKKCVIHKVGNKLEDEMIVSQNLLELTEEMEAVLLQYIFSGFKAKEYYNLHSDDDMRDNAVYASVETIFDNPDSFYEQSVEVAKYLYSQSESPKIKSGKLMVVHLENVLVDGQLHEAVGFFKIESSVQYMKLLLDNDNYGVSVDEGIALDKMDKGCLIFNAEREKGFWVAVSESIRKSADATYWIDMFLQARQREDEYFQTQNIMTLCKNFVTEQLPEEFNVTKADQASILSKSVQFFKENDTFDMETFANEIMPDSDVVESFKNYKDNFEQETEMTIEDNFEISENAVKKQSKNFKSVIKLDKNFHVYVHGDTKFLEKGFDDEVNMNYYRLYFRDEE